jgi:hypothetical protein
MYEEDEQQYDQLLYHVQEDREGSSSTPPGGETDELEILDFISGPLVRDLIVPDLKVRLFMEQTDCEVHSSAAHYNNVVQYGCSKTWDSQILQPSHCVQGLHAKRESLRCSIKSVTSIRMHFLSE